MFYRFLPWLIVAAAVAATIAGDYAWHALELARVPPVIWQAAIATCVARTAMKLGAFLMH